VALTKFGSDEKAEALTKFGSDEKAEALTKKRRLCRKSVALTKWRGFDEIRL
jgi:hypothetical protein